MPLTVGIFYFGKKGMGLNCNIFFKKNKDVLVNSVYLIAMFRWDSDMITRLNVADVALKEYKKDGLSVSMLAVVMGVWYQKPWLSFAKRMVASW